MAKIGISLPDSLLKAVEEARHKTGETRSEFLQRAAASAIKQERERQLMEQYVEGYRRFPEAADERAFVQATAHYAFIENPWDEADVDAKG